MFKKAAVAVAAATLAGLGQPAWAGSTGASPFTVTASVTQTCTVTTAPSNQTPAYDPVAGSAVDFTPTIAFKCTKDSTGIFVSADLGGNASGTQRRLSNGGSPAAYLNYQLYKPGATPTTCAYTTIYDSTAGGNAGDYAVVQSNFSSSSTAVTVNLCGRIAGGQDASPGSYADTVNVTVIY